MTMHADVDRPLGISGLALFFAFGMTMSALAAISLAIPGSALEAMWRINPVGREGLGRLGPIGAVMMTVVSVACCVAALGLWRGRRWGRYVAGTLLIVNAAGDLLNGILRSDPRTLIGVPIAAALLYYLRTDRVRAFFKVL